MVRITKPDYPLSKTRSSIKRGDSSGVGGDSKYAAASGGDSLK